MANEPKNPSDFAPILQSPGPVSVPIPDPTVRTIEQLKNEIAASREILEAKLDGNYNVIKERFAGMDKAIELLQVSTNKTSNMVKGEVDNLDKLVEQKLNLISTQIQERDVQREVAAKDVKSAVDAAFAASKEAVGEQNKANALSIAKSEAATAKQIDGITEIIASNAKTTDDKFNDIKDRLARLESHGKGVADSWGYAVGFIGMIVGIVVAFGSIITLVKH